MKNPTFQKLLIPIDFSVSSDNALDYALAFASKIKAEIVLLHTYNISPLGDASGIPLNTQNLTAELIKGYDEKLISIKKHIAITHPHLHIISLNLQDDLTVAIKDVCKKHKIDLVIMGSNGADAWDEYVFGTDAANVIEEIETPVLIIPVEFKFKPIKRILLTTDFQFDDVKVLSNLVEIATIFEGQIEVVHFSINLKSDEELIDWLREICNDRIDYNLINFTNILEGDDMLKTLNKFIKIQDIDLVSMSSTNKSFMKKIFAGSFTQKMAYHTEIPLLAFHIEKFNKI